MSVSTLSRQTVSIYPQGVRDKFNRISWGSAVVHRCRFQKISQVIATAEKEREPIDGLAMISGNPTVEIGDKLVYGVDNYKVMAKKENIDGIGNVNHVTLKVQKWST
jgi:hypothetical protein